MERKTVCWLVLIFNTTFPVSIYSCRNYVCLYQPHTLIRHIIKKTLKNVLQGNYVLPFIKIKPFYFPPVDSVRRTRTSCINGWSSRRVNTSLRWRCGYWNTYLQDPRPQDQRGTWRQPWVLLRPTSSPPCWWRSTTPSVRLLAPSAAFCSPWSVYPLWSQSHRDVLAVLQVA